MANERQRMGHDGKGPALKGSYDYIVVGGGAAGCVGGRKDPGEKQQESDVDAHHGARHLADVQ